MHRTAKLTALAVVAAATLAATSTAQVTIKKKTSNTSAEMGTTGGDSGAEQARAALRDLAAWRPAEARPALEKEGAASASSAELRTAWGVLQAEEGSPQKALDTVTEAAKMNPAAAAPVYQKGEILYQLDRSGDAKAAWQTARDLAQAQVKSHGDDAAALFYLGAAQVRTKEFAPARDALTKALAAGADPVLVHYQLGLSWAFDQKWQQAVDELTEVTKADSGFAHAYYYRGLCWDKLGRKDKMLSDFTRFVALAPNAPEADRVRAILAAVG